MQPVTEEPDQSLALQTDVQVAAAMQSLYDHYFACHDYESRYPQPNQSTLQFLMTHGAGRTTSILDFGCGNGRYAMALLRETSASLTGCDISQAALVEFHHQIELAGLQQRTLLVHGDSSALAGSGPFDLILMLFGVLSHVGGRQARIDTLRHLRAIVKPGGLLLLTVPNIWRRRPLEVLIAMQRRWRGIAKGLQAEVGNILFARRLGGRSQHFFYHLYTVARLREELLAAGFQLKSVEPESLLPEWFITQHQWIGAIDARLARFFPAALGYGIRAVARPL